MKQHFDRSQSGKLGKLGVSIGRVNDLVRTVYKKLGVHGKAELAKLV